MEKCKQPPFLQENFNFQILTITLLSLQRKPRIAVLYDRARNEKNHLPN